jgi:hypothetical protein
MADEQELNRWQKLSTDEKWSVGITIGFVILLGVLAYLSNRYQWLLWLAVSVGGLGGLAHEISQSGGKIMFFQKHEDGVYLGSVAGIILGSVAGLLVARGHLTGTAAPDVNTTELAYEIFVAGLALKGVTEAAGGTNVPEKPNPLDH